MLNPYARKFVNLVIGLLVIVAPTRAQETVQSGREAMYYKYLNFASYVKGGSIEPHWMADGISFWYAEGTPDNAVIYKVDPKANSKIPLFDTLRLRNALRVALGHEPSYEGLPFEEFTFVEEGEKAVKFTIEDNEFILQFDTYTITQAPILSEEQKSRLVPQVVERDVAGHPFVMEVLSPDLRWFAGIRDYNLWLRSTNEDHNVQMTTDGSKDDEWDVEGARWSQDGSKLALMKVDYSKVPKIPIVHWLKSTEEVEWVPIRSSFSRTKVGRPLPRLELFVVDVRSKEQIRINSGEEPNQHLHIVGWRPDGSEMLFLRASRTLQKLELMAANPYTGTSRVLLTETQTTFVVGINIFRSFESMFSLLEGGTGFIWMSEREGWNHLYLYDIDGNLIRRLTPGDFPVESIEGVDEKTGWVYFTAHADKQRPYDTQLYRVNLEGKRLSRLTKGAGEHDIQLSPSMEFFLDTHSSVDRPPVVELRKADGTLVRTLTKANIDALKELNWRPPEKFVVKAADGKTDLYGILYKPYDFAPDRKYPVIESIYGCPQLTVVPRSFTDRRGIVPQALAQLGFIVFKVDARGTPGRGKDFQDVVYGNMGRHEIRDHVTTLKQLAERRPYMDLGRVGITGRSCGGYFTIRAMLLAPDVYRVGVARAPVVDLYYGNAMEVYMGLPKDNKEAYEYASNLPLAGNLKGKLLLIHGTSDFSAPLSQTIRMTQALIQAGKPYDMLVLPDQDHAYRRYDEKIGKYVRDAVRRYFQEHLKPEKVLPLSEEEPSSK